MSQDANATPLMTDSPEGTTWGKWIHPLHWRLTSAQRQQVVGSPGWVVFDDFLTPHVAEALRTTMADRCVLRRMYGLFGPEPRVSQEAFLAADDAQRFYANSEYAGPRPGCELDPAHATHLLFPQVLRSSPAIAWFSAVAGVCLSGLESVTGRVMDPGDFLRPHADNKPGRGLCGVLYLNADWRDEDGGHLQMYDAGRVRAEIAPRFNRLVLFAPTANTVHAVRPVSAGVTSRRLSYSLWYSIATEAPAAGS